MAKSPKEIIKTVNDHERNVALKAVAGNNHQQGISMKDPINQKLGRVGLFALAGLFCAGMYPAMAQADSTEEIINLLKTKNIITADEATQILERHKNGAEQAATPSTKPKPVTIVLPKGQKSIMATTDPAAQKMIQDEVSRQVKEGIKEEVAKEIARESSTMAALDWTKKLKFGGDMRVRYQSDFFDDENAQLVDVFASQKFPNSTIDRQYFRYQARLWAKAQVNEEAEVGLRLATGNAGDPISTNDTLGDYMTKDSITFDQAYIKWTPWNDTTRRIPAKVDLWGGRMPTPFLNASDLVWDSDVNFEGLATTVELPFRSQWKGFFNAGVFPIQEVELSAQDKWLLGGQVGVQFNSKSDYAVTLAAAYYDYQNVQGSRVSLTEYKSGQYDYIPPAFRQKGNVLFDFNPDDDSIVGALASDYNELNLTAKFDYMAFDPIHVSLVADYVRNLGFDNDEVNSLTGGDVPKDVTGYLVGLTVGHPKMDNLWDWQTSLSYKYLEADAVLDAFTDSDFHLGGTNAKGWILGGQLGLGKNFWLRARWLSSDVITGTPVSIDTLQFDINSRF